MSFQSMLRAKWPNNGTIKRSTVTTDSNGDHTKTWATIYRRVPCRINAFDFQNEAVTWDQNKVKAELVIYIEHRDGITEGDRFYLADRIFDIRLVQEWDEAHLYLKLAVVEVRA